MNIFLFSLLLQLVLYAFLFVIGRLMYTLFYGGFWATILDHRNPETLRKPVLFPTHLIMYTRGRLYDQYEQQHTFKQLIFQFIQEYMLFTMMLFYILEI